MIFLQKKPYFISVNEANDRLLDRLFLMFSLLYKIECEI